MFSDQFINRIKYYKYARWAEDLTEEHFEALLWAIGEFGCRASTLLAVLHNCHPEDSVSHARAVVALDVLAEFTRGNPVTLETLLERVRSAVDEDRSAMKTKLLQSDSGTG